MGKQEALARYVEPANGLTDARKPPTIAIHLLPVRLAARPGRGYLFGEALQPGWSSYRLVSGPSPSWTGRTSFHAAREAFGCTYPNYDTAALAAAVCQAQGWALEQVRFYTGVPTAADNAFWNHFWSAKLLAMSRTGAYVFSRSLRYRNKTVQLPGGQQHAFLVGEEKGIDVRIAIDVIRLAGRNQYDVAVIFSQDQDLSEAADEVRLIAQEQQRWIKLASAFPFSPTTRNTRGINKTDWVLS